MNNRVRYLLEGAISLGLLGVSFWLVHDTRAIQSRRCQQDECGWMAAGDRTFRDLVLERRWDREVWTEGMHQTRYGWMNPTLGKLFFGLVLYADGYELPPPDVFPRLNRSIGRLNRPSDWYAARTVEHYPYLVRLRTINAWVMALCAVSLYHLARMFGGRLPAVVAALIFAATPLVRLVACQVGTDSLTLLLSIVSVAITTRVLGTLARGHVPSSVWRTFAGFCVVGLLLGLGVSTKLNGAVSCILFGTATVVLWVFGKFRRYPAWMPGLWLLAAGTITAVVFVGLNPYLWDSPIGRTLEWVRAWSRLVSGQQGDYPQLALIGGAARFRALISGILSAGGVLGSWTPYAVGPLVCGGLILVVRRCVASFRSGPDPGGAGMVLLWPLAVWVMTWAWIPLDMPRYYLPLLPPACVLAGTSLAALARYLVGGRAEDAPPAQ